MRGLPPFFLLRCFVFLLQFILYACPFVILLAGSKRRAGLNMVSSGEVVPGIPAQRFVGVLQGNDPKVRRRLMEVSELRLAISAHHLPPLRPSRGRAVLTCPIRKTPACFRKSPRTPCLLRFPRNSPRLPTGSLLNCLPRRGVWRWISWQIKDNPVDSSGANVSSIKKMRRSVRQGAATNRAARFPLLSTPTAAAEIFELGGILCSRAAIVSKRDILPLRAKKGAISSRSDPSDVYALSDDYSALLARNTYRARRRFSRSKSFRIHLLDDSGAF